MSVDRDFDDFQKLFAGFWRNNEGQAILVKFIMSELQPRDPDANTLLLFLGGAVLLILCAGSVLLFNQVTRRIVVSPTPAPLPKSVIVPIPSPTAIQALAYPVPLITASATAIATARVFAEAAPTRSIGKSCRYGPSWINSVATPVPDGGHSEIQGYLCANGYWYFGTKDWVDVRTGGWGTDGIDEQGYILYNADGSIADRKFINLQGTTIPGPTN